MVVQKDLLAYDMTCYDDSLVCSLVDPTADFAGSGLPLIKYILSGMRVNDTIGGREG